MNIAELRQEYHQNICQQIIRMGTKGKIKYPNFADGDSTASVKIALGIAEKIHYKLVEGNMISGQTSGDLFESLTREFLSHSFELLQHIRPGEWHYNAQTPISNFDQYEHLAYLEDMIKKDKALASMLRGDYIIKPDIVVSRSPLSEAEINAQGEVIQGKHIAQLTPLRKENYIKPKQIMIASISCKWTIRSDRSQNTRTEALNLIRNRKGALPHIAVVTAEPLPTRIAALALGTGDIDCIYHFALNELQEAVKESGNEDQLDMLNMMVEGRRLRDISDLPFDLAI
jgi:hypothetical protein